MESIEVRIYQDDVYEEVAKATDYTGSKLSDQDEGARDRILAGDEDLADLGRMWDEAVLATNESLKEMLVSGATRRVMDAIAVSSGTENEAEDSQSQRESVQAGESNPVIDVDSPGIAEIAGRIAYVAEIEVSKSFDKALTASVESSLRSFFISMIIGEWFKFANKSEAADYFATSAEMMQAAERMLYSRKKPKRPAN